VGEPEERDKTVGDIANNFFPLRRHHYLTLLFEGKLFLAPIKKDISVGRLAPRFFLFGTNADKPLLKKVLDVGTGTGKPTPSPLARQDLFLSSRKS
jgi:hypothetical protein